MPNAYNGEVLLRKDLDLFSGAGFKMLLPFKLFGVYLNSSFVVKLASRVMPSCLPRRFRSECEGSSNKLESFSTFAF